MRERPKKKKGNYEFCVISGPEILTKMSNTTKVLIHLWQWRFTVYLTSCTFSPTNAVWGLYRINNQDYKKIGLVGVTVPGFTVKPFPWTGDFWRGEAPSPSGPAEILVLHSDVPGLQMFAALQTPAPTHGFSKQNLLQAEHGGKSLLSPCGHCQGRSVHKAL